MTRPVWTTFGEGGTLIGVSAATFTAGNAPSAISPQRWIRMTIDGVDGYLPWFSAGTPTGEAGGGSVGEQVTYADSGFDDGTSRLTVPNYITLDAAADVDAYGLYIETPETTGVGSSQISIATGATDTDYSGDVYIITGATSATAQSGSATLAAGPSSAGPAGAVQLLAGSANDGGNAGKVFLQGGLSYSSGNGGNVELVAGTSTGGTAGHIKMTAPNLEVASMDSTGASSATFSASNAPAAISPQKWIKVVIGGVTGYLAWFST